ncbi:O-antigen/teichoic acid export membrane protein [Neobacillus sp. B4I6]|uniref:oligosaccharide flippase family protein n=1 Tax=Neobacillus sp. B4I6 TaxID=3373925 RepID=UPI003D2569DF
MEQGIKKDKVEGNKLNLMYKLKKDTLQYAPAIIIPALLNVVAVMLFTRIFNPKDYGVYTLVITTSLVISSIFSQWIMQSIQRFRPAYLSENRLDEFNNNLRILILFISVLLYGLSTLIYVFFSNILDIDRTIYWSSVLLVFSQVLFNIGLVIYQSDMKARNYRIYQLINGVSKFLLSILIIFLLNKNVISIVWATAFSMLVLIIPIYKDIGLIKIKYIKFQRNNFLTFFNKMFSYGFPMIGWFLGNSLLGLSDRYIIKFFRGAQEVGIYSANYSLVTMGLGLICGPLLTAAHPVIMNYTNNSNKQDVQKTITNFSKLFLVITIPLSFYISLNSSSIVEILLGSKFREGSVIVPITIIGIILWNFAMYGHKGHEITGKTKMMMFFVFLSVFINIILNFLLVPKFGYVGAAIATLLANASYPILIYYSSSRTIKWIIPWDNLFKITFSSVLASFLTGILIYIFNFIILIPIIIKLIISALLGGFIYYKCINFFKRKDKC